jgi:hypothetical protein
LHKFSSSFSFLRFIRGYECDALTPPQVSAR